MTDNIPPLFGGKDGKVFIMPPPEVLETLDEGTRQRIDAVRVAREHEVKADATVERTKEAIVEHLWGDSIDMADNYDFIYTHIKNLRKKLLQAGCPDYIHAVYGMGYKFSPAEGRRQ